MEKVPFPSAGAGDEGSSPAVAAGGGMPVDPDSDSDTEREHPLEEPRFVFHAVDDERRQGPPPLLLMHHRRPRHAADKDREERLRAIMVPKVILCGSTLIFGGWMIYLANNPDVRAQPDFNWDVFVTASSALVMLFSLVSLLLSYLGVYGCPGLNQY